LLLTVGPDKILSILKGNGFLTIKGVALESGMGTKIIASIGKMMVWILKRKKKRI
jgi:hypothetical protein